MEKIFTALFCVFLLTGCYTKTPSPQQSFEPSIKKTQEVKSSMAPSVRLNVPLVKQMPELPRGCEITSFTMLLQYAGVNVDKMTLAKQIRKDTTPYQKKNGRIYFGNPNNGFVGDMYNKSKPGYGVYAKPIIWLGEQYLPGKIVNLTGTHFNNVLQQINENKPVWVINNTTFSRLPSRYWQTWNTPQGRLTITYKEHAVLVTGYDHQFIYFNDPLLGIKNHKAPRVPFKKAWEQMGKQAITYKD